MPGGFTQPLGLLAFPAIKAAGYTAFAFYLNTVFRQKPRNIFAVGISRMFLGLIFGTCLALLSFPFAAAFDFGFVVYFIGLIPVRILEWWIVIKVFYGSDPPLTLSDIRVPLVFGVLASFVLDVPALLGLVYATDFWIC